MQGRGPIRVVEKQWGREHWYANGDHYCLKRLYLKAGFTSSLHYHPVKRETFLVESGECWLATGGSERLMLMGDWAEIAPGTRHRFWNDGIYECVITEVSTTHDDADVVRIEESRQLREDEL